MFFPINLDTTRAPRAGEQNGREYYFIDIETFEANIRNDEFIEYTRFSNNYYGTRYCNTNNNN